MIAHPYIQERAYDVFVQKIVTEMARLVTRELLPAYASALAEQERDLLPMRADAWPRTIELAVSRIRTGMTRSVKAGDRVLRLLAAEVSEVNKKAFFRQLTGVNVWKSEPWIAPLVDSWVKTNSRLISSIPEQYLDKVAQRTHDMVRSGTSVRDYAKELEKQYGLSKNRANLIARTEIGKLNGQLSKARSEKVGIDEYEWSSSADERVRKSHAVLNGKICKYSDPTVYRERDEPGVWKMRSSIGAYVGIPGEDYQCRCDAIADVESYINSLVAA